MGLTGDDNFEDNAWVFAPQSQPPASTAKPKNKVSLSPESHSLVPTKRAGKADNSAEAKRLKGPSAPTKSSGNAAGEKGSSGPTRKGSAAATGGKRAANAANNAKGPAPGTENRDSNQNVVGNEAAASKKAKAASNTKAPPQRKQQNEQKQPARKAAPAAAAGEDTEQSNSLLKLAAVPKFSLGREQPGSTINYPCKSKVKGVPTTGHDADSASYAVTAATNHGDVLSCCHAQCPAKVKFCDCCNVLVTASNSDFEKFHKHKTLLKGLKLLETLSAGTNPVEALCEKHCTLLQEVAGAKAKFEEATGEARGQSLSREERGLQFEMRDLELLSERCLLEIARVMGAQADTLAGMMNVRWMKRCVYMKLDIQWAIGGKKKAYETKDAEKFRLEIIGKAGNKNRRRWLDRYVAEVEEHCTGPDLKAKINAQPVELQPMLRGVFGSYHKTESGIDAVMAKQSRKQSRENKNKREKKAKATKAEGTKTEKAMETSESKPPSFTDYINETSDTRRKAKKEAYHKWLAGRARMTSKKVPKDVVIGRKMPPREE